MPDARRAGARVIAAAIKRLELSIGDVLASPFCRTRESATLIFGRAAATAAVPGGPHLVARIAKDGRDALAAP